MFTGIIEAIGRIGNLQAESGDVRAFIKTGKLDLSKVNLGDSIAVNGVCLTVIEMNDLGFYADVSRESLSLTSLRHLTSESEVNLEKAVTPKTHLGGHIVSGHVDGLGTITGRYDDGRSVRFIIKTPENLAKYIAAKGSICVDGVSLTINNVNGANFTLNIVPHTLKETIIKHYKVGTKVNLEVDIISRYLERLLLGDKAAQKNVITESFLAEHGFIK